MNVDPIADLRKACERIKAQVRPQPNVMLVPSWMPERIRQWCRNSIALAERMLGIGCEPEGKFPTGWPWTKRAGRPSKEEKRLRDCLPGWRSMLKGLEEPEGVSDGGRIHVLSASEVESRIATLLAGDRRGGKTGLINEAREEFSKAISGAALTVADGPGYNMPRIYEEIRYPGLVFTNPNMRDRPDIDGWTCTKNPRPTGKRAQRRAGKEWNR